MGSPVVGGGRPGPRWLSLVTLDSLFAVSFICCLAFSDFSDFLLRSSGASMSSLTLVLLCGCYSCMVSCWLLWTRNGTGAGIGREPGQAGTNPTGSWFSVWTLGAGTGACAGMGCCLEVIISP